MVVELIFERSENLKKVICNHPVFPPGKVTFIVSALTTPLCERRVALNQT